MTKTNVLQPRKKCQLKTHSHNKQAKTKRKEQKKTKTKIMTEN